MKHFHAQNSNRKISGISFEPYDVVAGTWVGVYAASDPEEIENLTALAMSPSSGVTEISSQEYEHALKKKALFMRSLPGSNALRVLTPSVGTPLKGDGRAVVVVEPVADVAVEANNGMETLNDVLQLDRITTEPTPPQKQSKTKKL